MALPTGTAKIAGDAFDRVLNVQRPLVIAHLRSIRSRRPDATPEEVLRILERRYLTAVTAGGAAVGASAAIPAVGLGASLALSAVETGGFLETSALFAQSVTELHGIALDDPDRSSALVMTLILGSAGSQLVAQLAGEVTGGAPARSAFWGEMVTKQLPKAAVDRIGDQLRKHFLKRFGASQGASVLGRAIPFGIGAVVGGAGNNILGRQVVRGSRDAFGALPEVFPPNIPMVPYVPLRDRRAVRASRRALPPGGASPGSALPPGSGE